MPIPPYTPDIIRASFTRTVYQRASAYVRQVRRLTVAVGPDMVQLDAEVQGSARRPYETSVRWDGRMLEGRCTCPYGYDCKHAVAVAKAGLERVAEAIAERAPAWRTAIAAFRDPPAPAATTARPFVFRLMAVRHPGRPEPALLLAVGSGKGDAFKAGSLFGVASRQGVSSLDRLIAKGLEGCLGYRYYGGGMDRWVEIGESRVDEALRLLAAASWVENSHGEHISIHPDQPVSLALRYERLAEGARLTPVLDGADEDDVGGEPLILGQHAPWLWTSEGLFPLQGSAEALKTARAPIEIPDADRAEFEHRYLPDLALSGRVTGPDVPARAAVKDGKPTPQLVLEEQGGALVGRLGYLYGGVRVEAGDPARHVGPPEGPWYRRSEADEARWRDRLATDSPAFTLKGDAALDFLYDAVPALLDAGVEVLGEDRLSQLAVHRGKATTSFSVRSGIDWLDVAGAVHIDDEAVPWPALWEAIAQKRRYVTLGSGRTARLPADWLEAQRPLFEALGLGGRAAPDGRARVQRYQAPLVDRLLAGAGRAETDDAWQAFSRKLQTFGGVEEAPLPAGFVGTLRHYQHQGLNFLSFLRDYGLHGILADDMGLGKTVQAAALLAANHPNETGPSLVVAPTSVIHNWQSELSRFAPGLKTLVLHGPGRDTAAIDAHDVVITTYATARLDLESHRARTYHTVILDEAQAIKNPKSQTAEVVRALQARHRLCLTGTPIENNLMELWSQFSFLMPGMLGKEGEFKGRYAGPIAQGDRRAAEELKARIAPFILRRLKSEVARDLPPRTDVPVWCELGPAQRRLYDTVLAAGRARVMAAVADKGVNQSQITILDALLKLRQVCCHPGLLGTPETLRLPSAKVEAFLTLVDELVANGHRALVFSQFTSMLAILRERLDAAGVAYEYLDGATKHRQARVDRFNASDTPLFLISLKAGGTGLNLTGADYVIHFDPWWNPAVEDQATDRAHRIGQTRHVFNYKLLAKDTVEEKLLALQERKRALVRDVLDADALGKQLTIEDLNFVFGGPPMRAERQGRPVAAAEAPGTADGLATRMRANGLIRSADVQAVFGVDGAAATRLLGDLVAADVLVKEGERRGTRYRPGPGWPGWVGSGQPSSAKSGPQDRGR